MKKSLYATDWQVVKRADDSLFLTCGSSSGPYHEAFDIATEDFKLATRFTQALNYYNSSCTVEI